MVSDTDREGGWLGCYCKGSEVLGSYAMGPECVPFDLNDTCFGNSSDCIKVK